MHVCQSANTSHLKQGKWVTLFEIVYFQHVVMFVKVVLFDNFGDSIYDECILVVL